MSEARRSPSSSAHFKSKLITYDRRRGAGRWAPVRPQRRGRAAALRRVRRLPPRQRGDDRPRPPRRAARRRRCSDRRARTERAVVLCGDLNDEPAAATTQIVVGPAGSEVDLESPAPPSDAPTTATRSACSTARSPPARRTAPHPCLQGTARPDRPHLRFASPRQPGQRAHAGTVCSPDPLPSMGDEPHRRRNEPARTTPPCTRRSPSERLLRHAVRNSPLPNRTGVAPVVERTTPTPPSALTE